MAVESLSPPARELRISQSMTLGRASVMLALMIGLSRLTGFGRMVVTSYFYGISPTTDAYNAAFNIPDTLSILIAGGALATGFVPVFTGLLARGEQDAARQTFRAMLTLLGLAFGLLSLLLWALTYTPWGALLAPAKVAPSDLELYKHLLRILLAAQFFFVLGGLFSGTLNALRLFWYAALQPVAFNLGIILFGIVGPVWFGAGIESQAWGALFGALVGSLLIQVPGAWRNGLSIRPLWNPRDEGVRQVARQLGPIVFGLSSGQLIALSLPLFFAAKLGEDYVSALNNANRLMQLPIAVLASGPAIALFPTLSLLAAQGNLDELRDKLTSGLRRTLLLMLLASALLMALGEPIIRLLLQHGAFDDGDTRLTSGALWCYALGAVGLGAQQILSRGFYALGEVRAPVVFGALSMAGFAGCGFVLLAVPGAGASSLALAASLATSALGLGLALSLRRRLGAWDEGQTVRVLMRGVLAAILAFAAAYAARRGCEMALPPGLAARALVVMVGSASGGGAFLAAARMLGLKVR